MEEIMKNLRTSDIVRYLRLCIVCLLVLPESLLAQEIKEGMWRGERIKYLDGQLCVKVREGVTREDVVQLAATFSASVGDGPDMLRWILFRLPSGTDVLSIVDSVANNSIIETCEPHVGGRGLFDPDDEFFVPYQWTLYNRGDICSEFPPYACCVAGEDINVRNAWNITLGSPTVPIAILDSGIPLAGDPLALNHPDLDEGTRIILGQDFIDMYYPPEPDASVTDWDGHGTQVAGIIGAQTANDTGIAGVAGGCKLQIHQVMAGDGTGFVSPMAFKDAVIASVAPPYEASILNFSASFDLDLAPVKDAIAHAHAHGVLVVSAAMDGGTISELGYPAEYSSTYNNVIAVGPAACSGCPNEQHNSSSKLSVLAPGGGADYWCDPDIGAHILTTHPSYLTGADTADYKLVYGTSATAAHVSGVAGLILSLNPDLDAFRIREIIEKSADDKGLPGKDDVYGWGNTNAYQAVLLSLAYNTQSHSSTATANNGHASLCRERVNVM
jgi:subtilisin family serine protease